MIWWPFGDSEVVAGYRVDGAPIALIGLKTYNKTDRIAVHGLVSHQTHLSAAIMIEWEVNHAKQPWSTINLYSSTHRMMSPRNSIRTQGSSKTTSLKNPGRMS